MNSRQNNQNPRCSTGFQKRMIRGPSNKKILKVTNQIKKPTLLNSKNEIPIQNKYSQSLSCLCQLAKKMKSDILTDAEKVQILPKQSFLVNQKHPMLDSIQQLEKLLLQQNKENTKIFQSPIFPQKSIQTILSEIQQNNIESGLKYLYSNLQNLTKIIEISAYIMGMSIISQNQYSGLDLTGDQGFEVFSGLLPSVVKELRQVKVKQKVKQIQSTQVKFKTIFRAVDDEKQQVIKKLPDHKQETPFSHLSQNLYKQLRLLFDQKLKKRDQDISKLRGQLLILSQQVTRLSSAQASEFNRGRQKKEQRLEGIQQEFQKLRRGFLRKHQTSLSQFVQKQGKLKKQLFKIQKQLQNCQWQNRVLIKKYQFLIQCQKESQIGMEK